MKFQEPYLYLLLLDAATRSQSTTLTGALDQRDSINVCGKTGTF